LAGDGAAAGIETFGLNLHEFEGRNGVDVVFCGGEGAGRAAVSDVGGARQVAAVGVVIDATTAVVVEEIASGIVKEVAVIAPVIGVAAGVVCEAAAVTVVYATEGAVVTETDATRVVHDVAVVAFDEPEAIVSGAEFGVASAVVAVVTVGSVVVEGEQCVWRVVAGVDVVAGDAAWVAHDAAVVFAAAVIVVVGGATVVAAPGMSVDASVAAAAVGSGAAVAR